MKKIITLATALMLGVLFITGCTKKRTGSSSSSSSSSSSGFAMKATVGSTSFNVNNCYAITNGAILNITGNSGTGTSPTPPYLGLMIQNYTGPGTYTVSSSSTTDMVSISWEPTSVLTDMQGSTSGTITITSSSSSSIVGTFSGTLTNGTTVSGGTFTARKF